MIKLPKGISHSIEHNSHVHSYISVEEHLEFVKADITDEERALCIQMNELWEIRWYPDNTVGFYCVYASTLEKALELANEEVT